MRAKVTPSLAKRQPGGVGVNAARSAPAPGARATPPPAATRPAGIARPPAVPHAPLKPSAAPRGVVKPAAPPSAQRVAQAARPSAKTFQTRTPPAPAQPKPPPRPAVLQRMAAPSARARVIQAAKFYPNLHPGAVERIEPASLFRLESFTDQYRLRKSDSHGVYVPNQLYNFVRTAEGATLLHNRYRHPSIAEGRQVLYAGEAFFNNGRLEWWSNGSGHYQPDADDAAQAALPLDNFYTYQQVIKGEHKRRK